MSCPTCGCSLVLIWRNGNGEPVYTCLRCGFLGMYRRYGWFAILKGDPSGYTNPRA